MYFENKNNSTLVDSLNEIYDFASNLKFNLAKEKISNILPEINTIISISGEEELNEAFFANIKEVLNDSSSL